MAETREMATLYLEFVERHYRMWIDGQFTVAAFEQLCTDTPALNAWAHAMGWRARTTMFSHVRHFWANSDMVRTVYQDMYIDFPDVEWSTAYNRYITHHRDYLEQASFEMEAALNTGQTAIYMSWCMPVSDLIQARENAAKWGKK